MRAVVIAALAALALSACGGSGFDQMEAACDARSVKVPFDSDWWWSFSAEARTAAINNPECAPNDGTDDGWAMPAGH